MIWITITIISMHIVIHTSPRPLLTWILPTRHFITLTNQVCQIGLIQINICPNPSIMNKIGMIITTLHRVSGDTTSSSHIVNPPYQQHASYTPYQDQFIEKKSELKKSLEAFLESER